MPVLVAPDEVAHILAGRSVAAFLHSGVKKSFSWAGSDTFIVVIASSPLSRQVLPNLRADRLSSVGAFEPPYERLDAVEHGAVLDHEDSERVGEHPHMVPG